MPHDQKWTDQLDPEDLAFIRRFVLASGSLKEMAEEYGVSYPTIRARLDALIEKVRKAQGAKPQSQLQRAVRQLMEDGYIGVAEARKLLNAAASSRFE